MPTLSVLDVGHGNSAVLVDTEGVTVIDTGPGTALLEYLIKHEVLKIDILLLSHSDRDHIGGVIGLLMSEQIQIHKVFVNPNSIKNTKIWNDLVFSLSDCDKNKQLHLEPSITPDLTGTLNKGVVELEILAPNKSLVLKGPGSVDRKGRKLTSNSLSAVIRLCYKNRSIALLPGDIDSVGLDNVLGKITKIFGPG